MATLAHEPSSASTDAHDTARRCGIALIAALAMPDTRKKGFLSADEAKHFQGRGPT